MGKILAVISMLAASAGFADCPHWISVMPLHEGLEEMLAKDAADQVNTTFIDGIVWLCSVNPEGNPVSDRAGCFAKLYRKTAPILRRLSPVKQGVLLQSTMGHGGFPGLATPWQLYVKANGTSNYRMCPLDERFLSYIVAACRALAAEKPDFFMVDDDTRMISDGVPGCFCPLHLAEFEKRTGREWTREDVVAMLETGDSEDARTWDAVKADSLKRLFRTIRSCFGDDIPGMLCVVAARPHLAHAREFAQILAASGQTPVIRGGGAPYHHSDRSDAFHVVEMISHYAAQRAVVGNDVVYMQESDTCPHTLWATSAVRTFDHLVMLALNGCKGAKIWITRTGNCCERKSAEYYRRIFRENKGMMEWVANADIALRGVVVPCCGPKEFNFGDRYLGLTGIPYRFGEAGKGEVTALTVETLALLSHDDIRKMLSGLAVIDGPAAIWLAENGFANYIGVDAKPWNRRTIQVHEFDDGTRQNGMRTDDLADLTSIAKGARVLTRLLNRPNVWAQSEYEAPGSVLFENAEGGRVLTIAQPIPERMPSYYKAAFFSEGYRDAMVRWLSILSGGLPGGVCYLGVGPVTCEAGTTANGERIVVLNALDLDGDDSPELMIERVPSVVERLQGNGKWSVVRFEKTKSGSFRLFSPILTQRPAIFRFRDL